MDDKPLQAGPTAIARESDQASNSTTSRGGAAHSYPIKSPVQIRNERGARLQRTISRQSLMGMN